MARLYLVSVVVMCFIEVTLGSASAVLQQDNLGEARDVTEESKLNEELLNVLIDKKVKIVVDNALGRMLSTLEHLGGSGHVMKTEIRRLKSERESSEAGLSIKMDKLKSEMEKLKSQSESCEAGLSRMSSVTRRLRRNHKSARTRNEVLENRMDRFREEVARLNRTEGQKIQCCEMVNVTTTTDSNAQTTMIITTHPPSDTYQRILIARFVSGNSDLHQLTIRNNELSTYPYLQATHVRAVVYDPSENKIIFAGFDPAGIFSSPLDRNSLNILRRNILSAGLAVDAGRGVLFMTTWRPSLALARMGTDGTDFKTLRDLGGTGSSIDGIALDRKRRVIYICSGLKLMSVTYEGRDLTTLHTKRGDNWMYGVTIDDVRGLLYFSYGSTIMRRSLSGGDHAKVGEVDDRIWNLVYYNNTVYVANMFNGNIHALDPNNGNVTKLYTGRLGSVICVIP